MSIAFWPALASALENTLAVPAVAPAAAFAPVLTAFARADSLRPATFELIVLVLIKSWVPSPIWKDKPPNAVLAAVRFASVEAFKVVLSFCKRLVPL